MKLPKAISFEIKVLANLIKRKMDDDASKDGEDGLTGMQGWVIGYVKANADRAVFQRDIEKDFDIRRASVTGVLQLMERNGLIVRVPVEHDARLKKITLTLKANTLYEQSVQRWQEFESSLCSGLSEGEISLFFEIAAKLKMNLE